jgi:molecular chaperone DnaK
MRTTVDYGIDLGTSNSAIAKQEGLNTQLIEGRDGSLVPSIVHVDADSVISVGNAALARRFSDPLNTSVEFKRLMGTDKTVTFPSSGRRMTPVELSAEVLKCLIRRAEDQDGSEINAAIVTIPAMFQLPQCEATREASKLAGLKYAPLLQEPIAAAIASMGNADLREGYWLIYDLGGGTFDASLVRARNGRLQVLDHDGDNHLGGKDFDRVLARHAAEIIRTDHGASWFRRTDTSLAKSFELLRMEAERVRIALSGAESEEFFIKQLVVNNQGEKVDVRFVLNRSDLEAFLRPIVTRTTTLCREVLKRNGLTADKLKRMVLVGGPTLTPYICEIIESELGIEARHYVDPTQAVAVGAAIYASTQRIPSDVRKTGEVSKSIEFDLSYEAMTNDSNPLVAGRLIGGSEPGAWHIQISSLSGDYVSDRLPLREDRTFIAKIPLAAESLNVFSIKAYRDNVEIRDAGERFTILHGTSIAKPVLSQSVGVVLAGNSVCWYLRKGVFLPARETISHATTLHLSRGHEGMAVQIPLIQGEAEKGDRNTIVGVLEIRATNITRDLPVGSEVQVTLTVDEHSITSAEAYIPLLNQKFQEVVKFGIETRESSEIRQGITDERERLRELERLADKLSDPMDDELDDRVRFIEDLLEDGGSDDLNQADQMLRGVTKLIDSLETKGKEGSLIEQFESTRQGILGFIQGKNNEQSSRLSALSDEFVNALERGDHVLADAKWRAAKDLQYEIWQETPEYWIAIFEHLSEAVLKTANSAQGLVAIDRGKAAINSKNYNKLVEVCIELSRLLPDDKQTELPASIQAHIR